MIHFQKFVLITVLTISHAKDQCNLFNDVQLTIDEHKNRVLQYSSDLFEENRNISTRHSIHLDWSKILPDGYTSKINQTEVNNYKNVIENLLSYQIEPTVVLFSGNLPEILVPLGGWTNPFVVSYFTHYARQAFKLFGSRIKTWVTFYEPREICESFLGLKGDEFPLGTAEYLCTHNILRAHAETYHIYDKEFRIVQNGKISITLDISWMKPEGATNYRSAEQKLQFQFGLYANPILHFDYPAIVVSRVKEKSEKQGFRNSRLPEFTYLEKSQISQSYDFLLVNYKGIFSLTNYNNDLGIKPNVNSDSGGEIHKKLEWKNKKKLKNLPGFQSLLEWIQNKYHISEVVVNVAPVVHWSLQT